MEQNYYDKYTKYKSKYLKLQEMCGGGETFKSQNSDMEKNYNVPSSQSMYMNTQNYNCITSTNNSLDIPGFSASFNTSPYR
jgi:hypothetical protein